MTKTRRRFKQTVPFKDRLMAFAKGLRKETSILPPFTTRMTSSSEHRQADTAAHIGDWANSSGLQSPK